MYSTDNGFVISTREITVIIIAIVIVPTVLSILYKKVHSMIVGKYGGSEDYPGYPKFEDGKNRSYGYKFSDIADAYIGNDAKEDNLDTERQEKVIFEEIISNVIFRYDEKTKMLTIGEMSDVSNAQPIKVKLHSLDDLREFVDRLEDYVNE